MIRVNGGEYKKFHFPVGELHLKLNFPLTYINAQQAGDKWVRIDFEFQNAEEVLELLLLCDALKRSGHKIKELHIPYIPFGRQDRVMVEGEPFSLKVFADLVNSIHAEKVLTVDPHSEVTPALIENLVVTEQHQVFVKWFNNYSMPDAVLISPDGGALKKIYKLAQRVKPFTVIECSKRRNLETGDVSETIIHQDNFMRKDCFIVDDICDGGRTFIEIAKILRERNAGEIILMVSHGFFTKGLEVFDGLIDHIYTRNGKVK